MNRKVLLVGAAISAALSGLTATKSSSVETANKVEQRPQYLPRTFTTRKSAPSKPTTQSVAQQKMIAKAVPMVPVGFTRFIEKPYLRKVKYGKRRWVMV
jgi:hypothetical protein